MRSKYSGFSILELMVVVTIIGVMTLLALPTLHKLRSNIESRSAVRRVVALLKYARYQAIREGVSQKISFDPEANLCWVHRVQPDEMPISLEGKRFIFPAQIKISQESEETAFIFSPGGTSSGGKVIISGPEGKSYQVVVDPVTGRISSARRNDQ